MSIFLLLVDYGLEKVGCNVPTQVELNTIVAASAECLNCRFKYVLKCPTKLICYQCFIRILLTQLPPSGTKKTRLSDVGSGFMK